MTEREAEQQGLSFTGIYSSNKEEVKTRIAKERKEKPKARIVLVRVPHNPLSRSYCRGGCGWSAYACPKYRAYDRLEEFSKRMENHPSYVLQVLEKHDKERRELEANFREYAKIVVEAEGILGN